MAVKKCCVKYCKSCSTRKEDFGVTYHKYPKEATIRDVWVEATKYKVANIESTTYVCSRHFRKNDFQMYKDTKYVLKSDAIPSIFPWVKMETDADTSKLEIREMSSDAAKSEQDWLNSSKESDGENVEAIRKYIEQQERELEEQKNEKPPEKKDKIENVVEVEVSKESNEIENETVAVASCMLDMILNQSEEQIAKNNDEKPLSKQSLTSLEKGNNTMALSVGSKVEAKDFAELWYPAQIVEVDYDEMEVLVHYENDSKKHDEWITVSSPRLRPISNSSSSSPTPLQQASQSGEPLKLEVTVREEPKIEEKPKLKFEVGERCLARWRDNRRFVATISKDLGDGRYEIFFDDGFQWKCTTSRLYKYKDTISVDTSQTSGTSAPSPVLAGAGPSSAVPFPGPAYHTHLFDPNRDYLSSKSERREMKRKLNIKEIFNIGQKRPKKQESKDKPAKVVQPKAVKKKDKTESDEAPVPVKKEIPEAVASIIGTVKEETTEELKIELNTEPEIKPDDSDLIQLSDLKVDASVPQDIGTSSVVLEESTEAEDIDVGSEVHTTEIVKSDEDSPACIPEGEIKLEKFEKQDDVKHEQVIDKIKEVITKIEDDLNKVGTISSPKVETKEESVKIEETKKPDPVLADEAKEKDKNKKLSKIKKGKKLRLLQEKKVKRQVEKVKCELEEMKKQVEEMRKQMMMKTEELEGQRQPDAPLQMPESFLLPGEWCAKWVNGQPVGKVSELEPESKDMARVGLPRRSVQVEDKRLPEGWTKHMVRRSLGHSAGKWNVVLVGPDNRRFHTKTDMRNYFENNPNEALVPYEHALMDFGLHLKLSRRMGWFSTTPGGATDTDVVPLPASILSSSSPLVKRRKLSLNKPQFPAHKRSRPECLKVNMKSSKRKTTVGMKMTGRKKRPSTKDPAASMVDVPPTEDPAQPSPAMEDPLEDGCVYVGTLKVQIEDNLLCCPAEACLKKFRNNTLLQMHIKHYHRELSKMMGRTPKVLDLAHARTMPTDMEQPRKEPDLKTLKVKIARQPKRAEPKQEINHDLQVEITTTPHKEPEILKQDSPKLRTALSNKPVKRPRVLLPVRRVEPEIQPPLEEMEPIDLPERETWIPPIEVLDFEMAISTHTVTKPLEKKTPLKGPTSEDEEWCSVTSDVETRSSFPRSGTPDSKSMDIKPVSSESNEERRNSDSYMYTENGERIKIVHMKREEIINCHCGFREEDGLMVQCELCLCWQHALCHNIQKESEVPEKYTCSICLNPRRGRRSQRFLHDQDRLYEGLLPGAKPCESLRRSHELSGNLLRIQDALHALRVKYYVATKKDHPKLYLWAKDWENADVSFSQEKLNSDYSDLNIIINSIGKENLPVKDDQLDDDHDRYNQRDGLGPQTVLSGLLASPGVGSLDLPISTSELERLAKSVQEQDSQRVAAPQPEAAIENNACRERLLRHIQRCQALIDARLDSIEAQVAELESQDPSFEDDETADYFPRTKQTIQMLMRDLDNMEELGAT